jgi:hypothetical protein
MKNKKNTIKESNQKKKKEKKKKIKIKIKYNYQKKTHQNENYQKPWNFFQLKILPNNQLLKPYHE